MNIDSLLYTKTQQYIGLCSHARVKWKDDID